jgi:hypothetical protein
MSLKQHQLDQFMVTVSISFRMEDGWEDYHFQPFLEPKFNQQWNEFLELKNETDWFLLSIMIDGDGILEQIETLKNIENYDDKFFNDLKNVFDTIKEIVFYLSKEDAINNINDLYKIFAKLINKYKTLEKLDKKIVKYYSKFFLK